MESSARPIVAIAAAVVAFVVGYGLLRHPIVAAVVRFPVFLVVGGGALVVITVNVLMALIRPEVGERFGLVLVLPILVVRLVQVGAGVEVRLREARARETDSATAALAAAFQGGWAGVRERRLLQRWPSFPCDTPRGPPPPAA